MPIDPNMPFASEARRNTDEPGHAAFQTWRKEPTPQNSSALLTAISPILDSAVTSYGNASPTLRSRAKLMALHAMGSYDPQKGNMRTHLLSQLRGLRRYAGAETQAIAIPERIVIERTAVTNAEKELEDKLGRTPSATEIAAHTGISPKRLGYLRQANVPVNSGSLVGETGEEIAVPSAVPGDDKRQMAWAEFVHRDLDPVSQVIMEHSLGMYGRPLLPTGMLARKLNLSAGAISQRKAKIQEALHSGGHYGF
jgi:hypothetical protein